MAFTQKADPQFSQPVRQIVMMLVVLGFAAGVGILLFPTVSPVFFASPYLNGFILFVFFVGLFACFWQVVTLVSSVVWIESFALDRPGHEFIKAPRLLASLAALLGDRRARRGLTSSSTQSILESVGTRIEEQRDLTRYLINLLIFLGLLGTFYGLATVVPAVVETIRSLAPKEGQDAIEVFDNLMSGLEDQLGGMGTAFASSLLGLAGSLVVGLLELFASHAQNRFYRELEDWLSSITRIGIPGVEGEEALTAGNVLMVIGQTAEQIDSLREVVEQSFARGGASDEKLAELARITEARMGELARAAEAQLRATEAQTAELTRASHDQIGELVRVTETRMGELANVMETRVSELVRVLSEPKPDPVAPALLERIAEAQERVAAILESRDEDSGHVDAETRARLRSIDTQVVRILEDLAAGRQDLVTEIRQDISSLAEALRALVAHRRP
ncbi:MAG: biopolymer transporter ExbB [Rhodobacteraceae bacterium]|uniref:biopolymer transporter ExbB n=1 Tax=Amaricoccus sp. B4 TaxID=3368557 RepID=UPI000DACCB9B|nr:biopolymer transporter ExbB [Paracoccaceae bacterium]